MTAALFEVDGHRFRVDIAAAHDLAIPLDFHDRQPRFFHAPPAHAETFAADGFTGDTRAGGSCNVNVLRLNPHCNGTHTECIGHIVDDKTRLTDIALPAAIPATLININVEDGKAIHRKELESALQSWRESLFHRALIIRTLPNPPDKRFRRYDATTAPAYLDASAARLLREMNVQHLLVDLPSLDAMTDASLTAHRIFWGLPAGSRRQADAAHPQATVTEMIYARDAIVAGYYLLNLQVPAFATDAAPSRPILFPIEGE